MESKRIAGLAGVVAVVSAVGKFVPGILLGKSFEQGPPDWIPIFGTIGQTTTLYLYGIEIFGALLMIVLAVGFGFFVVPRLDFRYEHRQFFRAVVAGTTVPLVAVWFVGMATGVVLGSLDGFNAVVMTELIFRLFATISLPVVFGAFAGAALGHFKQSDRGSLESDETDSGITSIPR